VGINSNGVPLESGSGSGNVITSTIGEGGSFIRFSSIGAAIAMNVSSIPVFQISQQGNCLAYDETRIATEFRVSSMTLAADLALVSSLVVGTCYANQFVTLSDMGAKTDIRPLDMDGITKSLKKIHPYSFKYRGSEKEEIGLLAQEVVGVLPACVKGGLDALYVNYDSLVAVLIGEIGRLEKRVAVLEGAGRP
jgi:hypothetical protein